MQWSKQCMQRDRHIGPGLHITFWPHNAMPLPSIGPVFECTRISNQATLFHALHAIQGNMTIWQSNLKKRTVVLLRTPFFSGIEHCRVWDHCPCGLAPPITLCGQGHKLTIIRITNCAANSQNCLQYPTNQSVAQRNWRQHLKLSRLYFQQCT